MWPCILSIILLNFSAFSVGTIVVHILDMGEPTFPKLTIVFADTVSWTSLPKGTFQKSAFSSELKIFEGENF